MVKFGILLFNGKAGFKDVLICSGIMGGFFSSGMACVMESWLSVIKDGKYYNEKLAENRKEQE